MSAYDITEFLRTAYQPFAYCVPSKTPLNTAYQKGGVTLIIQILTLFGNISNHVFCYKITVIKVPIIAFFSIVNNIKNTKINVSVRVKHFPMNYLSFSFQAQVLPMCARRLLLRLLGQALDPLRHVT